MPRGRRMGSRRTSPLMRRQRRQNPPFCPSVAVPRAAPHGPAPHTSSKRGQIAAGSWKRAAVNRAAAPWASAKTAEIRVCRKYAYCRGITHACMRRFPRRLTRTPLLAAARGGAREPWVSFGVSSRRARAPRCSPTAQSKVQPRVWKGRARFPAVPGVVRCGEGLSAFGAPGNSRHWLLLVFPCAGQHAHKLGLQNRGRFSGCADCGAFSPGGRGTAGAASAHRAPLAFHLPSVITSTTRLNFGLFWDSLFFQAAIPCPACGTESGFLLSHPNANCELHASETAVLAALLASGSAAKPGQGQLYCNRARLMQVFPLHLQSTHSGEELSKMAKKAKAN